MKSLLKDTLLYGLATIMSRGMALLVLPFYTRILTPEQFGALEMIAVIGSLVMLVVPLEVGQALTRLYVEEEPGVSRRALSSTALLFSIGAYAAFLFLATLGAVPFSMALLGENMVLPFRIGAAYIATAGIFTLMQNQLRVELRSLHYAVLSMFYGICTLVFGVGLGYVLGFGLNGVLSGQLLASGVASLLGGWMLASSYSFKFSTAALRNMLRFSLPLVPSGLATFLTLQASRLMLGSMIGLQAVGLFGVAARVAGIVSLAVVGLQSALTPLIYSHYKEPDTPGRLARLFEAFVAFSLVFCLAIGLFSDLIVRILADAQYAEAASYVAVLALAVLLNQAYIFFPGIAIARRMHLQLVIFAMTGALSIGGNWLLIRYFGLRGGVVATLVVAGVFILLWVHRSQTLYPIPVRWARVLALLALFSVMSVVDVIHPDGHGSKVLVIAMKSSLLVLFMGVAWWSFDLRLCGLRGAASVRQGGGSDVAGGH